MATLESLLSKLPVVASVQLTLELSTRLSPVIVQHLNHTTAAPHQTPPTSLINSVSLSNAHQELHSLHLCISCANPGIATQLRHSHSSLLERLNHAVVQDLSLCQLLRASLQKTSYQTPASAQTISIASLSVSVLATAKVALSNIDGNESVYKATDTNHHAPHLSAGSQLNTQLNTHLSQQSKENQHKSAELIAQLSNHIIDPDLSASLQRLAATLRDSANQT